MLLMGNDQVEKVLTRRDFLKIGGTALTGAYALGFAGCGGGQGTSGKKFKIALSNSYIGNQWRIEMVNEFNARSANPSWIPLQLSRPGSIRAGTVFLPHRAFFLPPKP
jgi:hypothetical protein